MSIDPATLITVGTAAATTSAAAVATTIFTKNNDNELTASQEQKLQARKELEKELILPAEQLPDEIFKENKVTITPIP